MSYYAKSVFPTIQGEGHHAGRRCVFIRFAGCNLWTGVEEHRSQAICQFCDTDFKGTDGPGGGHFRTAEHLADHALAFFSGDFDPVYDFVVMTGGEPMLQINEDLVHAFEDRKCDIHVETNGTIHPGAELYRQIHWWTVSPKANADWQLCIGNELKLVFPQAGLMPDDIPPNQMAGFSYHYLQPMDGPQRRENEIAAIEYIQEKGSPWRLTSQQHKHWDIP